MELNMRSALFLGLCLSALIVLGACVPLASLTPEEIPYPGPQVTSLEVRIDQPPTAYPGPMDRGPDPSWTPFPTPDEPAPDETFAGVGNVANLAGQYGVSGKAVVAGLQTLIIQGFNYDGKGSAPDIRLVLGQDYASPAVVLLQLEDRPYESELLLMQIPSSVGPGVADTIAVYAPETGEVYAAARFGY